MFVFNAEFQRLISEPLRVYDSQHWFFILSRSPIRFDLYAESAIEEAGCSCLLTPQQEIRLHPCDEYAVIDWLEFSLSSSEAELVNSLPIITNRIVVPPNWPDLSSLIRAIAITHDSSDTWMQEKMSGYLKVLLYGIASGDLPEEPGRTSSNQLYARLLHYRRKLSDNLAARPSVSEAAKEIGLSVSRFEYLYHQYFGISFTNDLIKLRIRRSCVILQTTDWSISQISDFLGYEDASNFYRQFKKQVGFSPNAYRRIFANIP